jgi:hypothetical protein
MFRAILVSALKALFLFFAVRVVTVQGTKCPLIQTLASLRGRGKLHFPSTPSLALRRMAIYHFRASVISRSQGRSATAAIAYRAAERIVDDRTGTVFDYSRRGGVEHTEILAPDHAPDWVHDRSELWNQVEASETRVNSQVAREVRVALPNELDSDERAELVRAFCREQFVERGMVADIALHAPGAEGDERNHHAHILLTTREIDAEGFTVKNRAWNKVEALESWREAWSRDMNVALERVGLEERVDHRTLEAQRDEALELATAARDRGDESEELAQTVRAVSGSRHRTDSNIR